MALSNELIICESFYSIQGEGASLGRPAVFLRLAGCNLRCNGFSYRDPKTGEHLGCDTKAVWRQGERKGFHVILNHWRQQGWLKALEQGAHLVITGGEPLLQQGALIGFLEQLDQVLAVKAFIEIETNGTLLLSLPLLTRLNQINVSPKLSVSGELASKAWNAEVLAQLVGLEKAFFKFVIASDRDISEVLQHFLGAYDFDRRRVWLMPEGGTRQAIAQRAAWLVEQCKIHGFNYSPRLHIDIWDEATGV